LNKGPGKYYVPYLCFFNQKYRLNSIKTEKKEA